MIVIAFAVFFSSLVVTPSPLPDCSRSPASSPVARSSTSTTSSPTGRTWRFVISVRVLDALLPSLDLFLLADRAVHGEHFDVGYLAYLVAYALCYSGALLFAATGLFSRREFK